MGAREWHAEDKSKWTTTHCYDVLHILDDALVYSDDDRIERMFDALHRQSRDQQIIVLSCRQRAFQKLGVNTLAMVDWEP